MKQSRVLTHPAFSCSLSSMVERWRRRNRKSGGRERRYPLRRSLVRVQQGAPPGFSRVCSHFLSMAARKDEKSVRAGNLHRRASRRQAGDALAQLARAVVSQVRVLGASKRFAGTANRQHGDVSKRTKEPPLIQRNAVGHFRLGRRYRQGSDRH